MRFSGVSVNGSVLNCSAFLPAGFKSPSVCHVLMADKARSPSRTGDIGSQRIGQTPVAPGDHFVALVGVIVKSERAIAHFFSPNYGRYLRRGDEKTDRFFPRRTISYQCGAAALIIHHSAPRQPVD